MPSTITERLLNVLIQVEPVHEYARLCEAMSHRREARTKQSTYESMTSLVAYLLILVMKVSFLMSCYWLHTLSLTFLVYRKYLQCILSVILKA